jgi:shikimate kinase
VKRASDSVIAVIGMNAAGKSSFGRRLASVIGWPRVDTDAEFRELHGDEGAYIKKHGWPAFRAIEEKIVERSMKPGHVVVLGGGAIESALVRSVLKKHAVIVWIQASPERIRKRLTEVRRDRPEFPTLPSIAELKEFMKERDKHCEELADVAIYDRVPFPRHVPVALRLLRKILPDLPSAPKKRPK